MAGDYFSSDTIAAIATSLAGDGGVGIIRLSGSAALGVAQSICTDFLKPEPRYLNRINIRDPNSKEILDDGLAVFFPAGHSFTGEDVVELQIHGGRFLLQTVLNLLIRSGKCRLALPGEFSFRAVRNGKMSLSSAEALGKLIGAKSLYEVHAARKILSKSRIQEIDRIAGRIRHLLAQTELSIDFIDQDVEIISLGEMQKEIEALVIESEKLIRQMKATQRIAKGLQVTLAGLPNAGKSTLFNALLSEDRAIVSPEAGTTRDVITEEITIGQYYVRLADTAGIREAIGQIEGEGITKAKDLVEESDVVLVVVDSSEALDQIESSASGFLREGYRPILVLNKRDRVGAQDWQSKADAMASKWPGLVVGVSAASGDGLDKLLEAIRTELDSKFGLGLEGFLPTEFQLQMMLETCDSLRQVLDLLNSQGLAHPELTSSGLSRAAKALSDLVGETTPDTILAKIFSEFCIGK